MAIIKFQSYGSGHLSGKVQISGRFEMFVEKLLNKLVRVQYVVGSRECENVGTVVGEDSSFLYLKERGQFIRLDAIVSIFEEIAAEPEDESYSASNPFINRLASAQSEKSSPAKPAPFVGGFFATSSSSIYNQTRAVTLPSAAPVRKPRMSPEALDRVARSLAEAEEEQRRLFAEQERMKAERDELLRLAAEQQERSEIQQNVAASAPVSDYQPISQQVVSPVKSGSALFREQNQQALEEVRRRAEIAEEQARIAAKSSFHPLVEGTGAQLTAGNTQIPVAMAADESMTELHRAVDAKAAEPVKRSKVVYKYAPVANYNFTFVKR